MSETRRIVVTVPIAGEDFTIRTDASEEYTRECAAYVDRMIRAITDSAGMLQPGKAAVLAALAITDELFKAKREIESQRQETGARAARLCVEIARRTEATGLATRS
jgi:cell division protein ZapA